MTHTQKTNNALYLGTTKTTTTTTKLLLFIYLWLLYCFSGVNWNYAKQFHNILIYPTMQFYLQNIKQHKQKRTSEIYPTKFKKKRKIGNRTLKKTMNISLYVAERPHPFLSLLLLLLYYFFCWSVIFLAASLAKHKNNIKKIEDIAALKHKKSGCAQSHSEGWRMLIFTIFFINLEVSTSLLLPQIIKHEKKA